MYATRLNACPALLPTNAFHPLPIAIKKPLHATLLENAIPERVAINVALIASFTIAILLVLTTSIPVFEFTELLIVVGKPRCHTELNTLTNLLLNTFNSPVLLNNLAKAFPTPESIVPIGGAFHTALITLPNTLSPPHIIPLKPILATLPTPAPITAPK